MEVSRRHAKIGNKENAEPAAGACKKSKALFGASIHPKRTETQSNRRGGGGGSTQGDVQLLKTLSAVQKNAKAMPAGKTNSRQTLSKAFFAEQAVKQKKILEAANPQPPPQPPHAHAHAKPTAGLYKGKVIQSKIGSFRTASSVIAGEGDRKPAAKPAAAARVQSRRVDHATKRRSLSVTELPGHAETQKPKPKPARSNSVSDSPRQAPKRPTVTGRPPTALRSAPLLPPPPPRASRPAAAPVSTRTGVAGRGPETKVVGEKRVSKPSVSSSLSQYRVPMESMEDRRAKLADWLASKGKAPKRPVLARPLAKTKLPAQHHVEPESAVQHAPEPSQDLLAMATAVVAGLRADPPGDSVRAEDPAGDASSPLAADLLDDSDSDTDLDLPGAPEPGVNDIVVNLCDALSALATNEEAEDDCEMSSGTASEDERNEETPEDVVVTTVKTDVESGSGATSEEEEETTEVDRKEREVDVKDHEVDVKDHEVDVKDEVKPRTTEGPPMTEEDASSVKFNVRTTPYLQSVRKGLQWESRSATAPRRHKPDIKELKFLTPVRRSSRIHRNSSRLPALVLDHDPCVTSLAELARLDGAGDAADAYIYRQNPALLRDSHDPKKDLLK